MSQRIGFVSTYPPTQCGLATFTASLHDALVYPGPGGGVPDSGRVVRLLETPASGPARDVDVEWVMEDAEGLRAATLALDGCDVVILQHEFGVYGGRDGEDVVALLDALHVPSIVVLHTVLVDPTAHQREVLEAVVARADALVTMTIAARDRLAAHYAVDMTKVRVIPHGAHEMPAPGQPAGVHSGVPTILTWGLLGPGKGIEWGIDAMARLGDLIPAPRYLIAGQTHPKVLLHEGERYRNSLRRRASALGVGDAVQFDDHYRDGPALARLVAAADVVLLPYDSTQQVTSGVLIEAVAAGKPVVATRFPHAVELLAGGAGFVVPHQDPVAIAAALRSVLTRRDLAADMAHAAAVASPELQWSAVARRYRVLADELVGAGVPA